MRYWLTPLGMCVSVILLATAQAAVAQTAGTGTLVGHVSLCRSMLQPVGAGDGDTPDLTDVTPGFKKGIGVEIRVPAADVPLVVQGTTISTRTDATGGFTLAGVPASQPLTLVAQFSTGPSLALNTQGLTVNPGQTLDVGTVFLTPCGDAQPNFTPQLTSDPPTAPADQTISD